MVNGRVNCKENRPLTTFEIEGKGSFTERNFEMTQTMTTNRNCERNAVKKRNISEENRKRTFFAQCRCTSMAFLNTWEGQLEQCHSAKKNLGGGEVPRRIGRIQEGRTLLYHWGRVQRCEIVSEALSRNEAHTLRIDYGVKIKLTECMKKYGDHKTNYAECMAKYGDRKTNYARRNIESPYVQLHITPHITMELYGVIWSYMELYRILPYNSGVIWELYRILPYNSGVIL